MVDPSPGTDTGLYFSHLFQISVSKRTKGKEKKKEEKKRTTTLFLRIFKAGYCKRYKKKKKKKREGRRNIIKQKANRKTEMRASQPNAPEIEWTKRKHHKKRKEKKEIRNKIKDGGTTKEIIC